MHSLREHRHQFIEFNLTWILSLLVWFIRGTSFDSVFFSFSLFLFLFSACALKMNTHRRTQRDTKQWNAIGLWKCNQRQIDRRTKRQCRRRRAEQKNYENAMNERHKYSQTTRKHLWAVEWLHGIAAAIYPVPMIIYSSTELPLWRASKLSCIVFLSLCFQFVHSWIANNFHYWLNWNRFFGKHRAIPLDKSHRCSSSLERTSTLFFFHSLQLRSDPTFLSFFTEFFRPSF